MSWSEPEFGAIAGLITAEFGVAFPPARRVFAEAAIRRAVGLARERILASYRERLAAPVRCADCPDLTICTAGCPKDPEGWSWEGERLG